MSEATCDYTLNLSKSNRKLWKACNNGFDRYYIPEKDWFRNNTNNQSARDKNMCMGKALEEIVKNPDYSYSMNNKQEMELWMVEKC